MKSICTAQIDRIAVDRSHRHDKLGVEEAIGETEQNSTDDWDPDSVTKKNEFSFGGDSPMKRSRRSLNDIYQQKVLI